MSRPLTLWGIIECDGAARYIDRAVDAGVTRLIGPGAPDVVELARSRGLEVHPYVACTPLPTHGQRPVSYTWSLNYLGVDPRAPEARAILDRHRPILVGPNRGEPSVGPFAAAHPEYWARTGDGSDTLSFCDRLGLSPAFPEVRDCSGGGDRAGAGGPHSRRRRLRAKCSSRRASGSRRSRSRRCSRPPSSPGTGALAARAARLAGVGGAGRAGRAVPVVPHGERPGRGRASRRTPPAWWPAASPCTEAGYTLPGAGPLLAGARRALAAGADAVGVYRHHASQAWETRPRSAACSTPNKAVQRGDGARAGAEPEVPQTMFRKPLEYK